jgi:cell wall-associated NlpC family hydrolase
MKRSIDWKKGIPWFCLVLAVSVIFPACGVRTEPDRVWNIRGKIMTLAESLIGISYRYGGEEIEGFDCSGLVNYVYDCYGISLPRTAKQQAKLKTRVKLNRARPADILAFKINRRWHTALYAGGIFFIHAPKRGESVRKERLNDFWKKRLKYVIRIIDE